MNDWFIFFNWTDCCDVVFCVPENRWGLWPHCTHATGWRKVCSVMIKPVHDIHCKIEKLLTGWSWYKSQSCQLSMILQKVLWKINKPIVHFLMVKFENLSLILKNLSLFMLNISWFQDANIGSSDTKETCFYWGQRYMRCYIKAPKSCQLGTLITMEHVWIYVYR